MQKSRELRCRLTLSDLLLFYVVTGFVAKVTKEAPGIASMATGNGEVQTRRADHTVGSPFSGESSIQADTKKESEVNSSSVGDA